MQVVCRLAVISWIRVPAAIARRARSRMIRGRVRESAQVRLTGLNDALLRKRCFFGKVDNMCVLIAHLSAPPVLWATSMIAAR